MTEKPLSRIPFRLRDELMILSMARWMRFIGVVTVVGGLVMLLTVLTGLIYVGAALGAGEGLPALGKTGRVIAENRNVFFALGVFALVLAGAGTALGFVLWHAADDFERVARSDVADQDYITAGLVQLKTYLKLSVLLALAAALVGITAAIGMAARSSNVP